MKKYRLLWFLLSVIALLLAADYFSLPDEIIHELFDVGDEANIPTWFSSALLLSVAFCAFGIQRLRHPGRGMLDVYFWGVFALAYLYFSLDEVALLHETTSLIIERKSYRWVYLYLPFAGALFAWAWTYFRLERNPDTSLRNLILGGMFVAAFGGFGLELLHRQLYIWGLPPSIRHFEFLVEEGLEMVGASMILQGCWLELHRLLELRFERRS